MDKVSKMLAILQLSILLAAGAVIGDSTPDGAPAQAGEFPHHVSLRFMVDDGLMHFCSGSIVDKEWVMTSATCCQGRNTMPKGKLIANLIAAHNCNHTACLISCEGCGRSFGFKRGFDCIGRAAQKRIQTHYSPKV